MVSKAQKIRKKEKRKKMRKVDALLRKAEVALAWKEAQSFETNNIYGKRDPVPRKVWFNIKGWRLS